MMGTSSVTSSDLSALSNLVAVVADSQKSKQVITDLITRLQDAKDAEASLASKETEITARSAELDTRESQIAKTEQDQAAVQKDLDSRVSIVSVREQAVASNEAILDQHFKTLYSDQAQLADMKNKFEVDAAAKLSDIASVVTKKALELQNREDAVTARENNIAEAQADLDAWKQKVAAAAALVAAVGKN